MARSASDATRFTATIPNATSKPSNSSIFTPSNIQTPGRGALPGETPQQKIARLRAAAAAARAGKESNFDRIVTSGRRWADRAHRVTAYSLIGLTVASGIIASFAIGDMLIHNRRKRSEWLLDQQTRHRAQIDEARAMLASGQHITEDQMLLLNQERAAWEAQEAQKNKKGLFARAKESLFNSVPDEETKGGKLAQEIDLSVKQGEEMVGELMTDAQQKTHELGISKAVKDKVEQGRQGLEAGKQRVETGLNEVEQKAGELLERRPTSSTGVKVLGGPLDREAQAASDAVKQKSQSWTDWVLRR